MQKSDKTLLKATGWIFLVWGFATIFLDVLFLMLKNVPADALWVQTLAGNLDMMAISVVMGCLEILAGVSAIRWAGKPKKARTLMYVGGTLLLLFLLEAFAFYTQNGQFYWLRIVAGVICAGLLVYGAYREVE